MQKKGSEIPFPWPPGPGGRVPNLAPEFVKDVSERIGLAFVSDGRGDLKKTFGPEDIFHYIYAVFHSPAYRSRYAEFLKIDFPRVPVTSDRALFARLARLGAELARLHLLEADLDEGELPGFPVQGDCSVEKPRYVAPRPGRGGHPGRVYMNKTQYFEGIGQETWDFHVGGYQVLEKWLKDRKGRTLSLEDISHYRRVAAALARTIGLMTEIDRAIPAWPIE
ncbi:MAG: type ISP restriction/modification enzyme [Planctomycetota bacterium]